MPWQSVASQPAQESYATKIYITKKFILFLGSIQTLSKSCERHLHSCSLMPWQQSEACQLWSLLSSGELCHIETSGDGGSHQDHIMTVCQITPTSLIMVWSQLRQYSIASAYLASMYCVLCTICTLYPDTIWDTITNLPSLYLDRWCALLHSMQYVHSLDAYFALYKYLSHPFYTLHIVMTISLVI